VRSEDNLHKRARVAVGLLCLPLRALPFRVRPPEDFLEIRETPLHFCERRTAKVPKYIGIPAGNFRRPLVFGIATVRAQYSDFRKSPGNLFQVNGPHAAGG